jgi:hypothetical protein
MPKNNFSCDRCLAKISYKELLNFNINSTTICKSCHTTLYPVKTIPLNWAFFIGFVSTVVPAEIIFNTTNRITYAFTAALAGGILAILGIAIYTYLSTEFRS